MPDKTWRYDPNRKNRISFKVYADARELLNYDALDLEKMIDNCGLVTYEGCTHYAYLERINQTISVLRSFLGGN